VAVFGVGCHFREAYLPVLSEAVEGGRLAVVALVDTPACLQRAACVAHGMGDPATRVLGSGVDGHDPLKPLLVAELDALGVDGIICCTPPENRGGVYLYALDRSLPVLVDKPFIVHENCSVDPRAGRRIADDSSSFLGDWRTAGAPRWEMMVQRSAMAAYRGMAECIAEGAMLGAAISTFTAEHADGQLRTRAEHAVFDYHGVTRGYGVGAHSMFHHLQVLIDALRAGPPEAHPVGVAVHASARRPRSTIELAERLPLEAMMPGYTPSPHVPPDSSRGEIDLYVTFDFYNAVGNLVTHATVNTMHTSLTERTSFHTDRADPYRGQGRLKGEHITIEQDHIQRLRLTNFHMPGGGASLHSTPTVVVDRHPGLFAESHLEIGDDRTTLDAKADIVENWLAGGPPMVPVGSTVATSTLLSLAYECLALSGPGRPVPLYRPFTLEWSTP
jgi:predicted dehydrogenase